MRDYDFAGLSTRSFEKLVQALALQKFGARLVVYGDGPDGGREATFEGKIDIDPKTTWDGYVVLQAKFKQRPQNTKADADWAIEELNKELKAFAASTNGRRRPDYYIFATNVVLSAVQKKGSKDKLRAALTAYQKKHKLRGFLVWDYDQLRAMLDACEDIRRAYTAFITPGDVLAEVFRWLKPASPDFRKVMTLYLARELRNAQFTNLERAGKHQILLSRVFVDLPSGPERFLDPPREDQEELVGFLSKLREYAGERFNEEIATRPDDSEPGRYVLVGGPGQGKTTLAQFACQLFRAAILQNVPTRQLEREVRDALTKLNQSCIAANIELPASRRFPIFVTLSEFASALARSAGTDGIPTLTLLAYIVERVRRRTDSELSIEDFRQWLESYPWLLVLDGLDEVPSSSNRGDVMRAVSDFWDEVAQSNADVLFLGTTRPQDYKGDFHHADHQYLVPLSPKRALPYARRLIEETHSDTDRRELLMRRLEEASENDATRRLMRSPLQVTIMATLVDTIGRAPQDKWRLFSEYFGAIYRREMERDTHRALLSQYRSDIETIHYRVGLELQVASEAAGGTDARLSRDHFESIVRQRLASRDHKGEDLEKLTRDIVDAATGRLVFIVEPTEGSFGFEIRSLQEFMAAEAIMSGDTSDVRNRLRTIAPVASWRNVFIFAAGRCFARDEVLIDTITSICNDLNVNLGGHRGRAIKAGSLLALELMEDGSAAAIPYASGLLATTALELLAQPGGDVHRRLADVYDPRFETIYRRALDDAMSRTETLREGAWAVLFRMAENELPWATEIIENLLPSDPEAQFDLYAGGYGASQEWRETRVLGLFHLIPADKPLKFYLRKLPSFVRMIRSGLPRPNLTVQAADLRIDLIRLDEFEKGTYNEFGEIPANHHPDWTPIKRLGEISRLTAATLAEILDGLTNPSKWFLYKLSLPWPAAACVAEIADISDSRRIAGDLRAGKLGDYDDWIAAEKRWEQAGASVAELENDLPWSTDIRHTGFPTALITEGGRVAMADYAQLGPRARRMIARAIGYRLFDTGSRRYDPMIVEEMVSHASDGVWAMDLMVLVDLDSDDPRWIEIADRIGRTATSAPLGATNHLRDWFLRKAQKHPDKIGLIRGLVILNEDLGLQTELPLMDPCSLEPDQRWVAVSILVENGFANGSQMKSALHAVLEMSPGRELTWLAYRASNTAIRVRRFGELNDRFFLELEHAIARDQTDSRRPILDYLTESFRRDRSRLGDKAVWKELNLPDMPGH